MKDFNEKIGDHLNDILEKNIDAENGFEKAEKHTESTTLASYFRSKCTEKKEFIAELKTELAKYGEKFEDSGSTTASLHRGWMDFKSMVASEDDESMLEEVVRGEKAALEEYDEALRPGEIPETTANLLRSQYDTIQSGLIKIKSLEDLQ